jgi:Tol biopolymer transport system component
MPTNVYSFANDRLAPVDLPASKPLRWADWHPNGSYCLIVGNGGAALRFDGKRLEAIDTGTKHNLRGAAFSSDGSRALLCGNRGALLLLEDGTVRTIASGTTENLRRIAWRPQGDSALVIGNSGTVLRYEASTDTVTPIPGDRAHTLRAVAWRPDGAYALVGAYASRWAGYPRPHPLYKCDGVYLQAMLHSDDEDDFVAVDWRPDGQSALIAGYGYSNGRAANKLLVYDGRGFSYQAVEASGALLGAAWHPSGAHALLCGENGVLLKYSESSVEQLTSATSDNLVGPFWRPDGSSALLLLGPSERVYTV